jgi:hypothetical protein
MPPPLRPTSGEYAGHYLQQIRQGTATHDKSSAQAGHRDWKSLPEGEKPAFHEPFLSLSDRKFDFRSLDWVARRICGIIGALKPVLM